MAGLWFLLLVTALALVSSFASYRWWKRRAASRGPAPRTTSEDRRGGATTSFFEHDGAAGQSRSAADGPLIVVGRPPRARYPLVFAHGYFGFDAIGAMQLRGEYFRGVRGRLEALGHQVHVTRVATAAGVKRRATELAEQILRLPFDRVNIIAHSMGGVDARYAISKLGLGARVASLTTVGTPHRGTPIADAAARLGELQRLRRMLDKMGANIDGLYDLTTTRMEEFNAIVTDASDVLYASVVGALTSETAKVSALLAPGYSYLRKRAGPNDGMVPATSQRWGEVLFEVEADHWAQIGWSSGFDAGRFYVALVEHLADRGL